MVRPFRWDPERRVLHLLDQRRLPSKEVWIECAEPGQVGEAIRDMVVRGAPAIGIAAAYAVVLGFAREPGQRNLPPNRFDGPGGGAPEHPSHRGQSLESALDRMRVSTGIRRCPMRPLTSPG